MQAMSDSETEMRVAREQATSTGTATGTEELTVEVIFTGPFQEMAGRDQEIVTMPTGSTLQKLLNLLADRYGSEFRDYVFVTEKILSQEVLVLVDGLNAGSLKGLQTKLEGTPNTKVEVGFLGPLPVGG